MWGRLSTINVIWDWDACRCECLAHSVVVDQVESAKHHEQEVEFELSFTIICSGAVLPQNPHKPPKDNRHWLVLA